MNRRYAMIVRALKNRYRIRVRRWRGSMSGCAWRTYHADGRETNWIEAPVPRSPVSLAVFLHEVGHHVIGFETYRRRCEEEHAAWLWALAEMRRLGVEPDGRTLRRFERSMQYAVGKAERRGIRGLPVELAQYSSAIAA
jgi:hypothetical protein